MDPVTQDDLQQGGVQPVGTDPNPNDANQGQPQQTDPQSQPGDTGTPGQVSDATPPVDAGKATRLEQDNAGMRRILQGFGIDPDSNTADLIRDGVITPEEYLKSRVQQPGQAQPTQQPPSQPDLNQKLHSLKSWIDSGKPVDAQTYREHMATMFEVVGSLNQNSDNLSQQLAQRDTESAITANTNAAKSVYSQSDGYKRLPDEVRALADDFLLGAADITVAKLVREHGDQRLVSPQGYSHAAKHASESFNKIVDAAYKAGQESVKQGISQSQQGVKPVNPGSGVISQQVQPKGQYGSAPLKQRVAEYLRQNAGQV